MKFTDMATVQRTVKGAPQKKKHQRTVAKNKLENLFLKRTRTTATGLPLLALRILLTHVKLKIKHGRIGCVSKLKARVFASGNLEKER